LYQAAPAEARAEGLREGRAAPRLAQARGRGCRAAALLLLVRVGDVNVH